MSRKGHAALIGFLGLAYSNCGIPLKPSPAEFGDSNVQSGDPNQDREEDSSAVPRTKAYLYLGSLQGLSVFEIDRKENRVTDVSVVAMPSGQTPSWIVFDRPEQRLFVSSANSTNVSSMKIDWTTGIPSFHQAWEVGPASVHLSIYRVANEILGLLTSYSDSQLSQFNLSTSGGGSTVSSNIPWFCDDAISKGFGACRSSQKVSSREFDPSFIRCTRSKRSLSHRR